MYTHTHTLKLKTFNFSRSPCMCAGNAVLFFLELHSFSPLWNCALWARKANCTAQCGVWIFLWQCDILGAGMTLLSMLSPMILIISWQKQPLTLNMKLPCAISPCHVVLQCFGWDACSRSSGTKWHKSLLGPQEKSIKKWDPSPSSHQTDGCPRADVEGEWLLPDNQDGWYKNSRRDRVACPSHRPRTCDGLCQRSRTLGSSDPPAHQVVVLHGHAHLQATAWNRSPPV